MIEPNYDKILQGKINYYGETKAAYEFAAYEYNKQYLELNKLSIQLVSHQRELLHLFLKHLKDAEYKNDAIIVDSFIKKMH